jgi:hypothetical protein
MGGVPLDRNRVSGRWPRPSNRRTKTLAKVEWWLHRDSNQRLGLERADTRPHPRPSPAPFPPRKPSNPWASFRGLSRNLPFRQRVPPTAESLARIPRVTSLRRLMSQCPKLCPRPPSARTLSHPPPAKQSKKNPSASPRLTEGLISARLLDRPVW